MKLRSSVRMAVLFASLGEGLLRFQILVLQQRLLHKRPPTPRERALWLHGCCRRIVRRLRIPIRRHQPLPASGLIVSNHLSHLDILIYGALGPIVFVSKQDVRAWPVFGRLAENGGTVFVDRTRSTQAATAAEEIQALLENGLPVLLFPEGTSSDGAQVLPFRSPLFAPPIRAHAPVTPAAIAYSAAGTDESALTYWGDKVFFPHLFATLGCADLAAAIRFAPSAHYPDRKQAAQAAHAQVSALRRQTAIPSLGSRGPVAQNPGPGDHLTIV